MTAPCRRSHLMEVFVEDLRSLTRENLSRRRTTVRASLFTFLAGKEMRPTQKSVRCVSVVLGRRAKEHEIDFPWLVKEATALTWATRVPKRKRQGGAPGEGTRYVKAQRTERGSSQGPLR